MRKTAEQLIASGKATHPVVGALVDTSYTGAGVRIASTPQGDTAPITKDAPAEQAGLVPGEMITTLDGAVVTGRDEFVVAIRAKAAGETAKMTVCHGKHRADCQNHCASA